MSRWIYYFLAFLFFVYPFSFYEIKLPFLGIIILFSILKILRRNRLDFSNTILALFTIYLLTSSFFIFYGLINGNAHKESLFYLLALYIFFPLIFLLVLNIIPKEIRLFYTIENIFIFSTISIFLVMFFAVLNKKGLLNESLAFIIDPVLNVDIRTTKDVVKISYHGISSLVFLMPYLFSIFFLDFKKRKPYRTLLLALSLGLGSYAVFISGRRALIIIFIFSIFCIICFKLIFSQRLRLKKKVITYILFVVLAGTPFLDFNKLVTSFSSTISFALNINNYSGSSKSDNQRVLQTNAFIKNIIKKPILGYGHGSYMKEVVRSKEKPWRYEISYLDIIYHVGFLGFFLYAIGPIWIIISLCKIIKYNIKHRDRAFAFLIGFSSILITYASNPYLNAFDIQWVIYLPIFFIVTVNRNLKDSTNAN